MNFLHPRIDLRDGAAASWPAARTPLVVRAVGGHPSIFAGGVVGGLGAAGGDLHTLQYQARTNKMEG